MPKLLAYAPEDGWAFVEDGQRVVTLRPPFLQANVRVVVRDSVDNAISNYGFSQISREEESWSSIVAFLRSEIVRTSSENEPQRLSDRFIEVAPLEVIGRLLNRLENEWLRDKRFGLAERLLVRLNRETRIRSDYLLGDRIAYLLQRISEMRAEREEVLAKNGQFVHTFEQFPWLSALKKQVVQARRIMPVR